MSTEQKTPASALTTRLEGRNILPRYSSASCSAPGPDGARRLRACVACKESKVRCKRDEDRPGDACERCVSVGRQCMVSAPARNKRPRRNISTVASLESKVDALVAALKVKQSGDAEDRRLGSPIVPTSDRNVLDIHQAPYRSMRLEDDTERVASCSNPSKRDHSSRRRTLQAEHQYSFAFFMPRTSDQVKDRQEDVIDQGFISVEEAAECFIRFTESMLPHFPVVVLPPGTTAHIARRTRPILFLAILGAASGHLGEGVRKPLVEELMRTYANRVMMKGDKSLDLLQAIQVSAIWYFPPEHFDEIRVYQLFHMAAIMATELDFGRAARPSTSKLSLLKDGDLVHPQLGAPRPKEAQSECQRAWLSCYIVCGIAFMITRRPNLMRWTSYMDECIQALETPGIGANSDLYLCHWARAQRIVEEVGQQLFMDDPSANIDVSDLGVQYMIQGYEEQINKWKAQMSPEIRRPTLQIESSILNLYLHEIYLYEGHDIKEFAPSFMEGGLLSAGGIKPLSPTHRRAFAICITSVRNIFDIFLSFNTDTLCSIPILHYVRTAYTVFASMKIHFAASRLDSDLQEMVKNDLNVEFYIDELLKCLEEVSRTRKLRVAAIFRLVLHMLRTWFQRQKSQTDPDLLHVRRNDTVFHTVLQAANAITVDGNAHDFNARADETVIASSFFHVQPTAENAMQSDVDPWPSEPDEEMIPWNDLDFESFLDTDNSMLLQIALERLGGLVG